MSNINRVHFNLTLVRHAETHANAEGIIQGLLDTELSRIGYLQAKALGQHLQCHCFSHMYSSDLKRAVETALQIHLFNRVSSCEIKYDSLLRERMYGIAEGQTRQWLRELAKESGVPYVNFNPPGAENTVQVRQRVVAFFRKLCDELLQNSHANSSVSTRVEFYGSTPLPQQDSQQSLLRSVSSENLSCQQQIIKNSTRKRSLSTGNIQAESITKTSKAAVFRSSIDSALGLSSGSSDQRSISSSTSLLSRNSSFEKQRIISKDLSPSPYKNNFSDLDILIVSHGAVIREFIKYFACDLQTDIGQHLDTIQDIAPNTSVTRFQITYSTGKDLNPTTTVELVDYHNKIHLTNDNSDEYNLDVVNKCSL
ncbi:unnamed protein product [Rotaria magnacalcarata]|uniref:Uncharacterized protein n=1 Tax=Rotaria magnacalcarata TaxID=392030 RepID=A0A816MAJ7_9BILA|nr:unnamed protein product [Rotaria magnacalcarata]CAF1987265.1 unnamed protein product [Rotaria magnacalcarata]CAF2037086.1 unnamed protein product [Rotaria magnacalcarata]CAF2096738.1 unnamed protein product [Rotaria magnacalcarata]CAF3739644.1 unnamed protein product [Rotaria magnacalcarata]